MARKRPTLPAMPARIFDRRSQDLPLNAEIAEVVIDDPLALDARDKIVASRSLRHDPLGRLHSHHQIDEAQYRGGRAFQNDWEKAERGPRAIDPAREYVDGARGREPVTEAQRQAVLRLNRIERELGTDGAALAFDVLVLGLTMEQVSERRGVRSQRWNEYFSKRLQECLDRLAEVYGFVTERRQARAR